MTAITLQGLTKRYGETTAVHELSCEIQPGRVTGFLGPNGSGKSTTMRIILGLDAPTAGQALLGGARYQDLPYPARQVGALLDAGRPPGTQRTQPPAGHGPQQRDPAPAGR